MHITTLISAAITLLGALVVMAWMPGRRTVMTEVAVPGEHAPAVTGAPAAAEAMAAAAPAAEPPAALAAGPARTDG
jgi:hypothetical protein